MAGRPGVEVDFSDSVVANEGLQSSLNVGTNGALPTGKAIDYTLRGSKQ